MAHKTQVLIKNTKPTTPHRLECDDEGQVVGIEAVHVKQGEMYATMRHVPATTAAVSTHDKSIPELLTETDWQPLELDVDLRLPDAYHRAHSPIFRYAIIHSTLLRDTVSAFLATASGEWSRQRTKGQTPDDWKITPLSDDHEMVVVDATLAQASQYGSAEAIASQTAEFASVDVVQWLNPDIDWAGMMLTNPVTGASETYASGEARINTLGIQQHQQVTAADIPSLAGYTVA